MRKKLLYLTLLFSAISLSGDKFQYNGKPYINLTNKVRGWDGVGPDGTKGHHNLGYTRIPAIIITNDNKILTFFDLRWNGAKDEGRIDTGLAISKDGGLNWDKETAYSFSSNESNSEFRRYMDSTVLYDYLKDEIYVLNGVWELDGQWYKKREEHYNNNSWSARIHKSKDGGKTWELVTTFSPNENKEVFSNTFKDTKDNGVVGFLGGVGTGIVMRDGTLVFPIQTAHKNGIGATIMYSKDHGKTWTMPKTTNVVAPNQSSLENMVFELEDGRLVLTGRGNDRWAYVTSDMGVSYEPYEAVNGFSLTTGAPSQGSSIYVSLPSGKKVLLVSKPNGNNDGYMRGNMALWALDAKNSNNKALITIYRPGSGNGKGAGYSSLAYKDGKLLVAYEDDGDISIKDLSSFIPEIEKKASEWNLVDIRTSLKKEIDSLKYLNSIRKEILKKEIDNGNENALTIAKALDKKMKELIDINKGVINIFNSDVIDYKEVENKVNEIKDTK